MLRDYNFSYLIQFFTTKTGLTHTLLQYCRVIVRIFDVVGRKLIGSLVD